MDEEEKDDNTNTLTTQLRKQAIGDQLYTSMDQLNSDIEAETSSSSVTFFKEPSNIRPRIIEEIKNEIKKELKKEFEDLKIRSQTLKDKHKERSIEEAEDLVINYLSELKELGRKKVSILELEVELDISGEQVKNIMEKLKDSGVEEIE